MWYFREITQIHRQVEEKIVNNKPYDWISVIDSLKKKWAVESTDCNVSIYKGFPQSLFNLEKGAFLKKSRMSKIFFKYLVQLCTNSLFKFKFLSFELVLGYIRLIFCNYLLKNKLCEIFFKSVNILALIMVITVIYIL